MYIHFDYISFKNFLSYPATETKFEFKGGFSLISAMNGVGKSSIIDALSYNLFGEPYRKIKLEELINRTNRKGLYTESQFRINKDVYKIIRTMKPDKLIIKKNDIELDMLSSKKLMQEEIDKILGIDYKMFKNVISLAINYNKSFLELSKQEKREIIELIFNVDIFGEMTKVLKKKISILSTDVEIDKNTSKIKEENIKEEKRKIDNLKKSKDNFEKRKKEDICDIEEDISIKVNGIEKINQKINDLKLSLTVISELNEKSIKDYVVKIKEEIKKNEDEIKSIEEKVNGNIIEYNKKLENIKREKKNEEFELNEGLQKLKENFKEYENVDISKEFVVLNEIKVKENECYSLEKDKIRILKKVEFFKNNNICPECEEKINEEKRNIKINEKDDQIKKILEDVKIIKNEVEELKIIDKNISQRKSLETNIKIQENHIKNKIEEYDRSIKEQFDKITYLEQSLEGNINKIKLNSKIKDYEHEIDKLKQNIRQKEIESQIQIEEKNIENSLINIENLKVKKENEEKREFDVDIKEIENEFETKCKEYKDLYNKYKTNSDYLDSCNIAKELLSEKGIKAFFFKKLIPILNHKINGYLGKFDLPVCIVFSEEMEEKISTLDGREENINYFSFSAGERKRIDLSILFSFIDTMKLISNWQCNIYFLDEVLDSGIDSDGLENLINNLKEMSVNSKNIAIYLISHKLQDDSIFDHVIKVEKELGFSKIIF